MNTGMLEVFRILNLMVEEGAIGEYALCGAMAAFEYIEPFATQDIDITAKMVTSSLLLDFSPITNFLTRHGMPVDWRGEGLMIAGYPVQFIPNSDAIDADALENARTIDAGAVSFRIWCAEHLMAKALQIGRAKDKARLVSFLETDYDRCLFCNLVSQFDLTTKWTTFCNQFEIDDVCAP